MAKTDLSKFANPDYNPGAGPVKRLVWYAVNAIVMDSWLCPVSGVKARLLRAFGAKIGRGVVIKPRVNIKYPWFLEIGNHVWLGEGAWIDNLCPIKIGDNACVSQGAMLLTGNHNYKAVAFDLMLGPITLEEGAWVCAQSVVCPGVTVKSHAVLGVGSVANKDLEPYTVYFGIPAAKVRDRVVSDGPTR